MASAVPTRRTPLSETPSPRPDRPRRWAAPRPAWETAHGASPMEVGMPGSWIRVGTVMTWTSEGASSALLKVRGSKCRISG